MYDWINIINRDQTSQEWYQKISEYAVTILYK